MNNNDNNDIVSIFENSFNNSNKINKQQYFIDNNNQIHERNVKKIMPRKPRPSDIMGNIRRTNTAPETSVNNDNNNNNNNKQYHARQTTTYNKKQATTNYNIYRCFTEQNKTDKFEQKKI